MPEQIVKVQVTIATNAPRQQCLIYNEDRSFLWAGDADVAVKRKMDGAFKRFFYASIDGDVILLGREAPWQDW